jgi:hypothetical protein
VKLGDNVITLLGTPYDYGSVMHYGAYGFAIDPTVPTIITIDEDAEIGQRVTLSAIDIERVQIHYGCLDPVSCCRLFTDHHAVYLKFYGVHFHL